MLVIVESTQKRLVGRRYDLSRNGANALWLDCGRPMMRPGRDGLLVVEKIGRHWRCDQPQTIVEHNGREIPAFGTFLSDGDILAINGLRFSVRIGDDLDAAYNEILLGISEHPAPTTSISIN